MGRAEADGFAKSTSSKQGRGRAEVRRDLRAKSPIGSRAFKPSFAMPSPPLHGCDHALGDSSA